MFCTRITNGEVVQTIDRFKNSKSPGPENISPHLLKVAADETVHPLS